jgi:hypothetical protein
MRPALATHRATADPGRIPPHEAPERQTATRLALLLILGGGLLTAGCGRAAVTVWRLQLRSPDGRWSALAQTLEIGGPGTEGLITSVYLEQTNMPRTRTVVLAFSCNGPVPRPYALDNRANAGGTIHLQMKWMTPTRLRVTYQSALGATLNFQAVRYQGVAISLTDLSASGSTQDDEHFPARVH